MDGLLQSILKLGPLRLAIGFGIAAAASAVLFALIFNMGGEEKALLFSNVEIGEASEITQRLEQANIPYELSADGGAILVARSRALEARMMLAEDGLPSRGSVGYEIFDRQDALGATQFQQNINRLRALEGELARTIASIEGVRSARVHLVLPERRLFEREQQAPTASIVIAATSPLTQGQVRAVRNLVAGATPGLSPQRITILDEDGRLLAAAESDDSAAAAEGLDARQAAAEERIRKTVQDIVDGIVGPGAARVQVSAEMDFSRVTQNSETFDPEGRVVRSTQSVEENTDEQEREANAGATAARNLPDAANGEGEAGSRNTATRSEETVNYEISKTVKTEVLEGGRIRRLSVAVAVDGVTTPGAEGQPPQWAARDAAEMERITALVRSAVGYDEARGDRVEVVSVRFAQLEPRGTEAKAPGALDLERPDIMRLVEISAALIAGLALVFFVLRPLVGGVVKPKEAAKGALAGPGAGETGAAALDGPSAQAALTAGKSGLGENGEDLASVDLGRSPLMQQVTEIVEKHPEESAAIVRGWLNNAG